MGILSLNMEELSYEITNIDENLAKSKPNMAAIAEYKKKEEVYLERVTELDKMTAARDEQRKHHDDLRKQRLNDFMEGFAIITGKLKEMYQMITLGGDAELELVDSLDPFAEASCSASGLRRNPGKIFPTSPEVRRLCPPWPWCSPSTTTSPRPFTSWTRLTPPWTSRTSRSWPTTSRREPGTL